MKKYIVFNLVLLFMLIPSFPMNYESRNEFLTQKNSDSPITNQIIQKVQDYHDLVIEGYGKSTIADCTLAGGPLIDGRFRLAARS